MTTTHSSVESTRSSPPPSGVQGLWAPYVATTATVLLAWFGLSNGLTPTATILMSVALVLSYFRLRRSLAAPGQSLFAFGLLIGGSFFFCVRGAFGRRDLENVPQGYILPLGSYSHAVALGSIGMIVALVVYELLRSNPFPQKGLVDNVPQLLFTGLALVTLAARLGLQSVGVGVKFADSTLPFQGYWLIGTRSASVLLVATLWVAALSGGDRNQLRNGLALVVAHSLVGALGGERGAVLSGLVILGFGYMATNPRRPTKAAAVGAVLGILAMLAGTWLSLRLRESVAGGSEFDVFDFLALRTWGPNRLGPIIDSEVLVGVRRVLFDGTIVREEVYGRTQDNLGVGASWFGLAQAARGAIGVIVVACGLGAAAAAGDRYFAAKRTATVVGFHVALSETFTQSLGGAWLSQLPRELIGYLAVLLALAVARRVSPAST